MIEDEAPAARRLVKMIQEAQPDANVLAVIDSVADGLEWIASHPTPDLVFSDIQLSDDLSFSIFKEWQVPVPVIFTTAYDEYAIQAFEHHSVDYLLKPIKPDALARSLQKFKEMQGNAPLDLQALMSKLDKKSFRSRFLVYSGENLIPVPAEDIAYLHAEDGIVMMYTKDRKRHVLRESLDALEQQLDPERFFRANRACIVEIDAIATLKAWFNQKLKLKVNPPLEQELIISKIKAPLLKKWLDR